MKHKTRLTSSKAGLHPIATAILLITILLTIAGITYIYLTVQNNAGTAIQIQSVSFQPDATKIYVQNIGKGQVNIRTVQIDNNQFDINSANCMVASEHTTTIDEGITAEITINNTYQNTVHIKVICREGAFYESDYKP
jgi:predicted 3-demethylubiquinone-9 3-methyltransferase (glyoxalase superfamily)